MSGHRVRSATLTASAPKLKKQRSAEQGDDAPPLPECELVPIAENLIAATAADFRIGGPRAFYRPSGDRLP